MAVSVGKELSLPAKVSSKLTAMLDGKRITRSACRSAGKFMMNAFKVRNTPLATIADCDRSWNGSKLLCHISRPSA